MEQNWVIKEDKTLNLTITGVKSVEELKAALATIIKTAKTALS